MMLLGGSLGRVEQAVEDRALAGEPVGLLLLAVGEGLLDHLQHAQARPWQRTALDE